MSRWMEIFRTGKIDPAPPGGGLGPDGTGPGGTGMPEEPDGTKRHAIGTAPRTGASQGKCSRNNGVPADGEANGANGANGTGSGGKSGCPEPSRRPGSDPDDPESWRRWYRRHVVLRSSLPRDQAERRAYGLAQVIWHRRHGEPTDPALCAGCGAPLADRRVLRFDSAVAVHFDAEAGLDCVIRFGARWRGAAERGLRRMGIVPPRGWTN
jgi:hypothetical protein